jgi:predicted nucleic acid-binding Zn ribbon protein
MSDRRAGGGKKKRPENVGSIIAGVLGESGLAERVKQASIIPEWASLVGAQIAAVTTPESITANGTLFVRVTTNAWMNELSLLEPELLRSLNANPGRAPVKRIRWMLGPAGKPR